MRKLPALEEAKVLMREASEWGVWKWLLEKRRVRAAADAAWAALGEAEQKAKAAWPDGLLRAYDELAAEQGGKRRAQASATASAELMAIARRVKDADDEAYRAHMDAEDIFAEAEKRLNTGMARQGAARAIEAWELTEKAIRLAETAARR
jgi:hypothetical protein